MACRLGQVEFNLRSLLVTVLVIVLAMPSKIKILIGERKSVNA